MGEVKTVGVKDLKNKLSAYLREVRTGVRVLVSDRDLIVAELHQPRFDRTTEIAHTPPISEWVRAHTVRLPTAAKTRLRASACHLPDGLSLQLLDEDRRESTE